MNCIKCKECGQYFIEDPKHPGEPGLHQCVVQKGIIDNWRGQPFTTDRPGAVISGTIGNNDWEYVIERVIDSEAQKHLNQWRHNYHIEIVAMEPVGNSQTYLAIRRMKK